MQNMCPDHIAEVCAIQAAHCIDVNKFCPYLLKTPNMILKCNYSNFGFPFMHWTRTLIFKSRIFLRIKIKISQISDLESGMFDAEDEKSNSCEN